MKTIRIQIEFAEDHMTRAAGERLRIMILEAELKNEKVQIDFSGVVIASTSFFDEGLAKLALHGWTKDKISSQIIIENLNTRDQRVLHEMYKNRGLIT